MLTNKDAIKIYNAIAYAMRQGVLLDTHIIIIWPMMGLDVQVVRLYGQVP